MAALKDVHGTRIKYTMPSLALSVVLSFVDVITALLENYRRKQIELRSGLSVSLALSSYRPSSIRGFDDRESMKKRVICVSGVVLFAQSSILNILSFEISTDTCKVRGFAQAKIIGASDKCLLQLWPQYFCFTWFARPSNQYWPSILCI